MPPQSHKAHKENLRSLEYQKLSAMTFKQLATRNSEEPFFFLVSARQEA
jgi:hypothetical protein